MSCLSGCLRFQLIKLLTSRKIPWKICYESFNPIQGEYLSVSTDIQLYKNAVAINFLNFMKNIQ